MSDRTDATSRYDSSSGENRPEETSSRGDVTRLLDDVARGRAAAADELYATVYGEFENKARRLLVQERADATLQTSDLVHEAWLRILSDAKTPWTHRRHFFAAVGRAMRRILVDRARRRGAEKRGGSKRRVDFESGLAATSPDPAELLAVNDAIESLERAFPRVGEIVHLHFFANLTLDETANALDVSSRTVARDWEFAKAFLTKSLRDLTHAD